MNSGPSTDCGIVIVKSERHQAADTNFNDLARGFPHIIEAEQDLLGAILINNEAYGLVSRLIERRDFYEPIHQEIYEAAGDLISAGKTATPLALKNHLAADLDITGISLNQCAEATTVITAPDYATVISNLAHRQVNRTLVISLEVSRRHRLK
jgi:replicative DNA helicase